MLMKNFIDLLFILLICAIVMLSESIRVGAVETAPPVVSGAGATPKVDPDEVRVVIVHDDHLILDENPYPDVDQLAAQLDPGQTVLIVSGVEELSHHKMMQAWSRFTERGHTVKLGVMPQSAGAE